MRQKLYLLLTMDVEPVKLDSNWTGPETAAESEKCLLNYRRVAREYGFDVSLFVHPEAAGLHRDILLDWHRESVSLGLHIHTTKFHYPKYKLEFGAYSAAQQREILVAGRNEWQEALNLPCTLFRPGAFSANDTTFPTLAELGFRGGSISIPGRIWPQRYCIWSGAEPFPHRAHATFRQVTGDLPFANIPLSVDFSTPKQRRGFSYFQDLRPTTADIPIPKTLHNIIAHIAAHHPPVPVIQLVAHNDQPFENPDSPAGKRYRDLLSSIEKMAKNFGYEAVSAGFDAVCEKVFALPLAAPAQWQKNNDVF